MHSPRSAPAILRSRTEASSCTVLPDVETSLEIGNLRTQIIAPGSVVDEVRGIHLIIMVMMMMMMMVMMMMMMRRWRSLTVRRFATVASLNVGCRMLVRGSC